MLSSTQLRKLLSELKMPAKTFLIREVLTVQYHYSHHGCSNTKFSELLKVNPNV